MKIAIIASSETEGGAEQYIYRLYSELRRRYDVEPYLIGQLPGWTADLGPVDSAGAGPKLTRRQPFFGQVVRSVKTVPMIIRAVNEINPDLIHVQYLKEKFIFPRILGRNYPIVWTEHGPLPDNFPPGSERILAWQARKAKIISVSDGVKESLKEKNMSAQTIPNAFPGPVSFRDGFKSADQRRVVLFAGRLHENKRVDLLVRAAALLPEIDFLIAGDGPARVAIEPSAPENVKFLGKIDDVSALYDVADLVVIPSGRKAREGCPLVMLEARSVGVRVLMAEDCHSTLDAESLGCGIFSPTVESLRVSILDSLAQPNRPISKSAEIERSTDHWAATHYEFMQNSVSARLSVSNR
ncbi:hypothetical protein CJ178_13160 [Rhodococcus sp. ACPA4]|uniref:glycosyltransferase n=1 Tax=Rhodococcus sp. ACPA4 TaxID=2028571 RepID=UPI000BB1386D|nr:glycosyltransferase [Rhodococcus sp. ACPA4]PBC42411.1 hypothetical protein CJ178_13160 [Rhodococcus sp. ACPA4]